MVVEAVVVGVDGTCPDAPGWVTIKYQLSETEHTTRDGKLEMARLENEAALGVNLAYPGAFRARLRAALGGTVVEATPPGIDGVFENLSDGEYRRGNQPVRRKILIPHRRVPPGGREGPGRDVPAARQRCGGKAHARHGRVV